MSGNVGVRTKPNSETLSEAAAPNPPVNADKKTTVGSGKLSMNTTNPTDDGVSLCIEVIDIDENGIVEIATFLFDGEDNVTYIYADKYFSCTGGGVDKRGILVAAYDKGNRFKKLVGSGWYAFSFDKGECGAEASAVLGMQF